MMAARFAAMERSSEAAMRALSERGELCRQIADITQGGEDTGCAQKWMAAMREAKDRTGALRDLLERKRMQPDAEPSPPSGA